MTQIIDIKTGPPRAIDSLQLWAGKKLVELNPSMETPGLEFDKENHAYKLEGSPLISITQLIKHFFPNPYLNDHEAMQRGTYIHRLCQQFVEIGNINWVVIQEKWPEIIPYLSAFRNWYNEQNLERESVKCEVPLASAIYGFAGTIDIVILEKTGIYNLYLKQDGKFDFIPRVREKNYNWNLFSSMLNVYRLQKKEK